MLLPPNCAKYLMHSHFNFIYAYMYRIYTCLEGGKTTDHRGHIWPRELILQEGNFPFTLIHIHTY